MNEQICFSAKGVWQVASCLEFYRNFFFFSEEEDKCVCIKQLKLEVLGLTSICAPDP